MTDEEAVLRALWDIGKQWQQEAAEKRQEAARQGSPAGIAAGNAVAATLERCASRLLGQTRPWGPEEGG